MDNRPTRAHLAWRMVNEAELADARDAQRKYQAGLRAQLDPLRYATDKKFIKLYRLSKRAFQDLCYVLRRHTNLRSTQRVSIETKVSTIEIGLHHAIGMHDLRFLIRI